MDFGCSTNVFSQCVKKWLVFLVVMFIVMPALWAQPTKMNGGSVVRKSCGRDLVARVEQICQSRGGHMTYTKARRVRRGIVNECCMNRCSDHHIFAYCSNERKPMEADSSIETPGMHIDTDFQENAIQKNHDQSTESPTEQVTQEPVFTLRENIVTEGKVDAEKLDQLIRTLPRSSNDFQVGTVPPEYTMSRLYIPSRLRINY